MNILCLYDELIAPKKLKPHPKNRNKHDSKQIDRLAEMFAYHGIRHPAIVSKRSGFIVAGHGRRAAAIKAKVDAYPVVYQDFESDEAEYAFLQADNAIALWADLDLAAINADLAELGPDFDINMLGIEGFVLEPAELPDLPDQDPRFQQRTFILSNEQNDILNEAMKRARDAEECGDAINKNKNGNILAAIMKKYVQG